MAPSLERPRAGASLQILELRSERVRSQPQRAALDMLAPLGPAPGEEPARERAPEPSAEAGSISEAPEAAPAASEPHEAQAEAPAEAQTEAQTEPPEAGNLAPSAGASAPERPRAQAPSEVAVPLAELAEAPLPPAVEREQVRILLDRQLSVEVSTQGNRVEVTLSGSAMALEPLKAIAPELGASLRQDGYQLEHFAARDEGQGGQPFGEGAREQGREGSSGGSQRAGKAGAGRAGRPSPRGGRYA